MPAKQRLEAARRYGSCANEDAFASIRDPLRGSEFASPSRAGQRGTSSARGAAGCEADLFSCKKDLSSRRSRRQLNVQARAAPLETPCNQQRSQLYNHLRYPSCRGMNASAPMWPIFVHLSERCQTSSLIARCSFCFLQWKKLCR